MGWRSVAIWLVIATIATADKLHDFSEVLGGYLPPSNAYGAKPPKDPFQGFSFDLPSPSYNTPEKEDESHEKHEEPSKPAPQVKEEHHEPICIIANPYVQSSHSHGKEGKPQQQYVAPHDSEEEKEDVQEYVPPKQTYVAPVSEEETHEEEEEIESVEQTYEAPHESEEHYEAQQTLESADEGDDDDEEQDEEPARPTFLYEPPEHDYSAPIQETYQLPQSPEKHKKTYQVPELVQTYGPHKQTYESIVPVPETPVTFYEIPSHSHDDDSDDDEGSDDDDSRRGSVLFPTHFTTPAYKPKPTTEAPKQTYSFPEKGQEHHPASLFFKVPEASYNKQKTSKSQVVDIESEGSDEGYHVPEPKAKSPQPQPTYEKPKTTYFIPTVEEDSAEDENTSEQTKYSYSEPENKITKPKSPSGSGFFSAPQVNYGKPKAPDSHSAESSFESDEDKDDHHYSDDTKDSQEEKVDPEPQPSYNVPEKEDDDDDTEELKYQPPEQPKPTYVAPQSAKKPKFRPIYNKPKVGQQSSIQPVKTSKAPSKTYKPSTPVEKPSKPTQTHNFFKSPSLTYTKSSVSKPSKPIKKYPDDDDEPKKAPSRPSGSYNAPSSSFQQPQKDDDSEEKYEPPKKQSISYPQKTTAPKDDDDDDDGKYRAPSKQSQSKPKPTYKAPEEESESQSYETSTKKMMMPYDFKWNVEDDESGNNYGQTAVSDGMVEKGKYHVKLPDGRTQIVTYLADWETGYHVDVKYEGEAQEDTQNTKVKTSGRAYS